MLTDQEIGSAEQVSMVASAKRASADGGNPPLGEITKPRRPLYLRVEWLGQMAASLLWIASCLVVGVESAGDWLQVGAASAWMVANLAALVSGDE